MRLLRLATGLVVASFVTGHFLNHSLGVVSIEAMDELRTFLAAWWRSPVGSVVLYGSLLTHFGLALVSLYRRTTLRMPAWEAAQLALGLAIPPLLIYHVIGTRFNWWLFGNTIGYERVVAGLWAEAVTELADGHVSDEVYREVSGQFDEPGLAALTFVVSTINAWNRLAIASRTAPGT